MPCPPELGLMDAQIARDARESPLLLPGPWPPILITELGRFLEVGRLVVHDGRELDLLLSGARLPRRSPEQPTAGVAQGDAHYPLPVIDRHFPRQIAP